MRHPLSLVALALMAAGCSNAGVGEVADPEAAVPQRSTAPSEARASSSALPSPTDEDEDAVEDADVQVDITHRSITTPDANNADVPAFSITGPPAQARAEMLATLDGMVEQAIADYDEGLSWMRDEANDEFTPPPGQLVIDSRTDRVDHELISIATSLYFYTGGANGTALWRTTTFDTQTGTELSIRDWITRSHNSTGVEAALEALRVYTFDTIVETREAIFEDLRDDFIEDPDSLTMFTVSDTGDLTVYLDEGHISAGVAGALDLFIEAETVEDLVSF